MLLLATATPALAQSPEDDVLAAVQGLFDAMARRDTAAAARLMLPDARTLRVLPGRRVRWQWGTRDAFLRGLAQGEDRLLERMWDAEVRIDGPMATVWTPYDFHLNGAFSHCGIDAFQLVRTPEGWKISMVMWTVRRENDCAESPLGPPE